MRRDLNDSISWHDELRRRLELEKAARTLLGVKDSAGPDEIKSAWRRCSLESHPDRNPGDPAARVRFMRVNAACRLLLDGVIPDVPLEDADTNDEEQVNGYRSDTDWGYFAWWSKNYFGK